MDELDKKIKHIWNKSKKPGSGMKSKKCPEDNIFTSYIDGILNKADREKVEQHILECKDCLDLVVLHAKVREREAHEAIPEVPKFMMKKVMDLVSEKDPGEELFDIVLRFARETIEIITNPGNLGISHTAVPVPVRGEKGVFSTNLITLSRTFSYVESVVDVERLGTDRVNIRTLVKDIKSGEPVEGLRISLFNPDREIASYITKKGEALFEDLRFGKYVIKISSQGKETGQISLNIKE